MKDEHKTSPEVKRWLSRAEAEAVLAEYPDADLSAFDIEGAPDVDALAVEVAGKSIARVRARLTASRQGK